MWVGAGCEQQEEWLCIPGHCTFFFNALGLSFYSLVDVQAPTQCTRGTSLSVRQHRLWYDAVWRHRQHVVSTQVTAPYVWAKMFLFGCDQTILIHRGCRCGIARGGALGIAVRTYSSTCTACALHSGAFPHTLNSAWCH